ncbi:hypothetical protein C448_10462 [Halococcus morrhuae DSM 1307]|uniref:Fido domain-containing protein n=1 Tax=Halococcus morrhuae DSM 1307 TaxID=931277 RepID=M0MAS7_HALMO|nr:hypothetical protein C448_10462 [Halococcus morrhuae DSM 1307]
MPDEQQGYVSFDEIIAYLRSNGESSPADISESRRRENVVRLQCRALQECGLVVQVTHGIYTLSERGHRYADDEIELPREDGEIDIEGLRTERPQARRGSRITDFSEIDAETIKRFNYAFYSNSRDRYGLVNCSSETTERRISNVKDFQLDRVMREFPTDEPLSQQCAHWVRAISGKHFFPDANHRTAMGSLAALLQLNGIDIPPAWPGRHIDRTVLKSKFVRNFVVDVRFDNLWRRDEQYILWHRHFTALFHDSKERQSHRISTQRLKESLENARKTVRR